MKIRSVKWDNRRKAFSIVLAKGTYWIPFSRLEVQPEAGDRVVRAYVDEELAKECFTYHLESGREGTVHFEHVLEYNRDPDYMREILLYKLTLEAQSRLKANDVSRREVIRRMGTSPAQFYRLLDQTNYRKSVDQMFKLLTVLGCELDVVVG